MDMGLLEDKLGYKFRERELLTEALTHSIDYTNNTETITVSKHTCDRLKLIGDCVIKLVTCQFAISVSKPDEKLGNITKIKDDVCNRFRQHQVGQLLSLQEHVIVTKELRNTPSFEISNHYETFVKSIMGAIFIDAGGSEKKGFRNVWNVFLKLWKNTIDNYPPVKQLVHCFPEPKFSSSKFLIERFKDIKDLKFKELKQLERVLEYEFIKRPHLLEQALTHDSIEEFGKDDFAHYQTLEFLGDSVIELIVMEYLYTKYDSADPLGQMLFFNRETGQKLYNSKFQVKVAKKLQLDQYVIKPPYVVLGSYDDFVESLIGAVYVNCGAAALKKTARTVLYLWGLQPYINPPPKSDQVANGGQPAVAEPPPPPPEKVPDPEEPRALTEIQSKLNYKFRDPRIITSVLELESDGANSSAPDTYPWYFRNLLVLGRRTINLLIVEYVFGIIPSDVKLNLCSKEKKKIESLIFLLSSKDIMNGIVNKLKLKTFVSLKPNGDPTDYQDYVFATFGAVYIDSGSDHSVVTRLFRNLWSKFIESDRTKPISEYFVNTSEEQKKFRGATKKFINDVMWAKLHARLGHKFKNKNLAEQALTDEKSLEYARHALSACPTGNPFALQLIGSAAIELFVAFRSFHNTAACPENFEGVIERFENSLFKVLANNLKDLDLYYVKRNKPSYTFPPKTNPRYPFQALLGAVYVDCGGGNKACEILEAVIIKQDPSLVKVSKGRAQPAIAAPPPQPAVFSPSHTPSRVFTPPPQAVAFSPSHNPSRVFTPPPQMGLFQQPQFQPVPPPLGMFSPPPGVTIRSTQGMGPFPSPLQMPAGIQQNSPFPMFPQAHEFPRTTQFPPSFYAPSPPSMCVTPPPFCIKQGSPGVIGYLPSSSNFRRPFMCTPPPDSSAIIRPPSVASSKSSKRNGLKSNSSSPVGSRSSTPKSINTLLNNSLNSKCAANFGFSPLPVQKTPKTQEKEQARSILINTFATPVKSPKKQKQPKSYASAVANGMDMEIPPNQLLVALTQVQPEINALKQKTPLPMVEKQNGLPQQPKVEKSNGASAVQPPLKIEKAKVNGAAPPQPPKAEKAKANGAVQPPPSKAEKVKANLAAQPSPTKVEKAKTNGAAQPPKAEKAKTNGAGPPQPPKAEKAKANGAAPVSSQPIAEKGNGTTQSKAEKSNASATPQPNGKNGNVAAPPKPKAEKENVVDAAPPQPKAKNIVDVPPPQPKVEKVNAAAPSQSLMEIGNGAFQSDNVSEEGGSKKRRGKRGGNKKKKNLQPPVTPPEIKTPSEQSVVDVEAVAKVPVAAPEPGPSTCTKISSCTQAPNGTGPESKKIEQAGTSQASVRVNKVHGYPNEMYKKPERGDKWDDKPDKKGEYEGVSMLTMIKWTTVALGVFFLINKYVNRK
ncbi:unnamed protein product [Orchesella dallaii]|uniref:RNase III domain-containing protein n=1 Tax=Orchesella dallaii TaxID=48710 RepID=A0ABP1RA68_9HEXA